MSAEHTATATVTAAIVRRGGAGAVDASIYLDGVDIGDGVQLTDKGERAHRAGVEERERLLERCRRAAGVDHV